MRDGIRQLAYVTRPELFDETVRFWAEQMQAGPFFLMDLQMEYQTFRGHLTETVARIALTFHGHTQLEIMCALDDEPSANTEWLEDHPHPPMAGLFHHFLLETDDFRETYDRLCAAGFRARTVDGRQVAYLDGTEMVGSFVELVQRTERATRYARAMQAVCRGWDGSDPVRSYESLVREVDARDG